jgi:AcrR family transcriptional regulator
MTAGPRRAPSQERSAKRVASILAAARSLLQENPASEVSIRGVAERAGTSPASIYRYFDDIDEVLDALVVEHATVAEQAVAEALAASRHRSVAGVFDLVVRTYLDLYHRRPELTVAWRSSALADRQRSIEEASDEGLARALGAHLVDRGLIRELTAEVEARLVADWTVAGVSLGLLLSAAPERRADREADLLGLVRWLARRY